MTAAADAPTLSLPGAAWRVLRVAVVTASVMPFLRPSIIYLVHAAAHPKDGIAEVKEER